MTATARDVARSRRPSRAAAEASWRSRPFWRLMWLRSAPGSWAAARCVTPTAVGRATSRSTATIVAGWRVGNVRRRMRTAAQTVGGPVEQGTLALPEHRASPCTTSCGVRTYPLYFRSERVPTDGPRRDAGASGDARPHDRCLRRRGRSAVRGAGRAARDARRGAAHRALPDLRAEPGRRGDRGHAALQRGGDAAPGAWCATRGRGRGSRRRTRPPCTEPETASPA